MCSLSVSQFLSFSHTTIVSVTLRDYTLRLLGLIVVMALLEFVTLNQWLLQGHGQTLKGHGQTLQHCYVLQQSCYVPNTQHTHTHTLGITY